MIQLYRSRPCTLLSSPEQAERIDELVKRTKEVVNAMLHME